MDGGLGAPAHPTTMLEDPRHAQLLALRQNLAQLQTLGAARTDIEPVAEKIVQLETGGPAGSRKRAKLWPVLCNKRMK